MSLVVPVADLMRRPGTQREIDVDGPIDDLVLSSARVPNGAVVSVRVVLEATSDASITATGTVSAPYIGECRRCLREVEGVLEAEVLEVFDAGATGDPGGDTYPLGGEFLDLEPMVRDVVLLGLPLALLCGAGCEGPDPNEHPVASVDESDQEPVAEGGDPRWAALRDVKFD